MKIIKLLLLLFLPTQVYAQTQYTIDDVSEHNTPDDCWVVFEESVYDLSDYIPNHDRFMDIREWCGMDMTEDFKTKAGIGRDHRTSSYSLLSAYYIGDLVVEELPIETIDTNEPVIVENTDDKIIDEKKVEQSTSPKSDNPYNLLLPLILTILIYWSTYYIFKKKNYKKFNAFWNTVLLLTFVIPSFGFGIFMMLRYNFPNLRDINFEFMYWHVELSVVMGVIALSHFIQRLKQYLVQLKK